MSFFCDILILVLLISTSSTFLFQFSCVDGGLVESTIQPFSADNRMVQPVSSSPPIVYTLNRSRKSGAFSLELAGILTLVPVEEQLKKACRESLTKFSNTHCPFGDLAKLGNLANVDNREKAVLVRARRQELLHSIFADHEINYLQSHVERIIDQCCESRVSSQPKNYNFKQAEGLIEHACKPGNQRSGDILNG